MQHPCRDTADTTSWEETGVKEAHTSFSSRICQNSENLLGEKLTLLDKIGRVAALTVLNSKQKRLCQMSIKRSKDRGSNQAAGALACESLYNVFNRESKFSGSIRKTGCLWHLGCGRGRCISPWHLIPIFPPLGAGLRPRFHGQSALSRMEPHRNIHNNLGEQHLQVNGFPIAAIPHLPAKKTQHHQKSAMRCQQPSWNWGRCSGRKWQWCSSAWGTPFDSWLLKHWRIDREGNIFNTTRLHQVITQKNSGSIPLSLDIWFCITQHILFFTRNLSALAKVKPDWYRT